MWGGRGAGGRLVGSLSAASHRIMIWSLSEVSVMNNVRRGLAMERGLAEPCCRADEKNSARSHRAFEPLSDLAHLWVGGSIPSEAGSSPRHRG